MEVGGKVSFSEAWSGRDFPYKSRSVLTWSVHPLWLSGPKLSKGSFHLKWPHTLTACRASSLRAFYFPACPGELNMLFPHSHGFPFCLECFSYSSLLFLPCPPPIHPANVLRSVSEVVSSGSLHQPTKMNHFPLGATHSSVLISTALTNHLGKRTVPFPRGLPLHPQVYEVPLWCGPVLLVLASQHPDWSEFNRVAE